MAANNYSILKIVAVRPDDTGMYRASMCACSDFAYERADGSPRRWSDDNLAELVRTRTLPAKAIRCDRVTWQRAKAGLMSGYCEASDVDAPVIEREWALAC